MKKHFVVPVLMCLCAAGAAADVSVTVYNGNLGLVRDTRDIRVEKGETKLSFDDIAALVDPTSVHIALPSAPGRYSVLEQNFEYDLVSTDKLLEKYIGREITVERRVGKDGDKKEVLRGTLLSTAGGIVLQTDDRILMSPAGEISLAKLPDGLILKPTLSWLLKSEVSGPQKAEIDYLTSGISWSADYVLVSGQDDKKLDLTGWVTVDNRSGATYGDAKLKLVAGDVHRAPEPMAKVAMLRSMSFDMAAEAAPAPQFQEKSFFEYHLYDLQRKTTLKNNETKQIEFIAAQDVPSRKAFVFDPSGAVVPYGYNEYARSNRQYGAQQNGKVAVMLEFRNSEDDHLGKPLPQGRIRVYKKDTDGTLQFIGEDRIDHTPKNEPVRIELGNAFDITGERTQTDFRSGDDWCEESFKITLKNRKDTPVEVKAVEHLYRWSNWKIQESSQKFEKKDSRTVEFTVTIPPDSEKTVTYRVRYWW